MVVDGGKNLSPRVQQQHEAEPNVSLPHAHQAKGGIYWWHRPAKNSAG